VKHWNLTIVGLALGVFLLGTSALTQQAPSDQSRDASTADSADHGYINDGSVHKLIIGSEEVAVYNDLANRGAIIDEIDYGSFKVVRVNEMAAGGRARDRGLFSAGCGFRAERRLPRRPGHRRFRY